MPTSGPFAVGRLRRFSQNLLRSLAALGAAIPLFRAGQALPAASAPFAAAPGQTQGDPKAAPARPLRRSLEISTAEGMFAEVVTAFAGGAVLTGWALHLGASPLLVGVLGSLPFLCQFVQLPSAWVAAAFGPRRVSIIAVALSRQALLPLVLLPWLPMSVVAKQWVLVLVAALAAVLGVIGNNAWVTWMGDLVPRRIRGRYFGRRTALCTLGGTLASLGAGLVLDWSDTRGVQGAALAILALFACLAGALTTWLMVRQQEAPPGAAPPPLTVAAVLEPLGNEHARRFLGYQLAWNAAIGLSGAYYVLHMLANLKMGFTLMAVHGASVAVVRILTGPLWGRALDRVGARPVLIACSFGISVIPIYWLFATADFLWPIALDVVVSATLWSGHGLATFSLPLNVAPKARRSFYLATFAMGGGLAYAAATFLGGALLAALPQHFVVLDRPMVAFHVILILSAVARVSAALLGLRIIERGARPVDELAKLLRSGVGRIAAPNFKR